MSAKYRNGRKKYHYHHFPVKFIVILLSVFLPFFILFLHFNEKIEKSAIEISYMQSQSVANTIIDQGIQEAITKLAINSSDFFISQPESPTAISANTILINEFCASVSSNLSKELGQLADEEIGIPLGMVTGVDFLANHGPELHYSLRPVGTANVDYDTSFASVGINQINFKIWINVNIEMKIVFPLHQETIALSRKIMVVDTVLSGTVPDHYLEFGK